IPRGSFLTACANPGSPKTPTPNRSSCFLPKNFAHISAAPQASDRVYTWIGEVDLTPKACAHVVHLPVIQILFAASFFKPFDRMSLRAGFDSLTTATTASFVTAIGKAPFLISSG